MNRTAEVIVGQYYRETGKRLFGGVPRLWVVERLTAGTDQMPYAVVVSVDDRSTKKTLSWDVLLDRTRYELVPATE
jgi:hypothetical protein